MYINSSEECEIGGINVSGIKSIPSYNDPNAIHKNIADEFSQVGYKETPSPNDRALIEDSDDQDNKKYINLGSISIGAENIGSGSIKIYADDNIPNVIQSSSLKFKTIGFSDNIISGVNGQDEITLSIIPSNISMDDISNGVEFVKMSIDEKDKIDSITVPGQEIDQAVQEMHIQGTDTTLGIISNNINMGSNRITNMGPSQLETDAVNRSEIDSITSNVFHKNVSGEINSLSLLLTPNINDVAVVESSQNNWEKRKVLLSQFSGTDIAAYHFNIPSEFTRSAEKIGLNDYDLFLIENGSNSFSKNFVTGHNLQIKGIDYTSFHSDKYSEFNSLELKSIPNDNDVLPIEDSESTIEFEKKKITIGSIRGNDENAVHTNVSNEFIKANEKNTPVSGDKLLIENSENSSEKNFIYIGSMNGLFSDEKAIHVDIPNEFSTIPLDSSVANDDYFLLEKGESSPDVGKKRKIQFSSIPTDHDPDAFHYNVNSEFNNLQINPSVSLSHDYVLTEKSQSDSQYPGQKFKTLLSSLPLTHDPLALHTNGIGEINSMPQTADYNQFDWIVIEKSMGEEENPGQKFKFHLGNIPTAYDAAAIHKNGINEFANIPQLDYLHSDSNNSYLIVELYNEQLQQRVKNKVQIKHLPSLKIFNEGSELGASVYDDINSSINNYKFRKLLSANDLMGIWVDNYNDPHTILFDVDGFSIDVREQEYIQRQLNNRNMTVPANSVIETSEKEFISAAEKQMIYDLEDAVQNSWSVGIINSAAIGLLQVEVAGLILWQTGVETSIADLTAALATVEGEVGVLQTEMTEVQTQVEELQTNSVQELVSEDEKHHFLRKEGSILSQGGISLQNTGETAQNSIPIGSLNTTDLSATIDLKSIGDTQREGFGIPTFLNIETSGGEDYISITAPNLYLQTGTFENAQNVINSIKFDYDEYKFIIEQNQLLPMGCIGINFNEENNTLECSLKTHLATATPNTGFNFNTFYMSYVITDKDDPYYNHLVSPTLCITEYTPDNALNDYYDIYKILSPPVQQYGGDSPDAVTVAQIVALHDMEVIPYKIISGVSFYDFGGSLPQYNYEKFNIEIISEVVPKSKKSKIQKLFDISKTVIKGKNIAIKVIGAVGMIASLLLNERSKGEKLGENIPLSIYGGVFNQEAFDDYESGTPELLLRNLLVVNDDPNMNILDMYLTTHDSEYPNDVLNISIDPTEIKGVGVQIRDLDMGMNQINNTMTPTHDQTNSVATVGYIESRIAPLYEMAHFKDHDEGTDPLDEDFDLGGDGIPSVPIRNEYGDIIGYKKSSDTPGVIPHKIINMADADWNTPTDGVNMNTLINYVGEYGGGGLQYPDILIKGTYNPYAPIDYTLSDWYKNEKQIYSNTETRNSYGMLVLPNSKIIFLTSLAPSYLPILVYSSDSISWNDEPAPAYSLNGDGFKCNSSGTVGILGTNDNPAIFYTSQYDDLSTWTNTVIDTSIGAFSLRCLANFRKNDGTENWFIGTGIVNQINYIYKESNGIWEKVYTTPVGSSIINLLQINTNSIIAIQANLSSYAEIIISNDSGDTWNSIYSVVGSPINPFYAKPINCGNNKILIFIVHSNSYSSPTYVCTSTDGCETFENTYLLNDIGVSDALYCGDGVVVIVGRSNNICRGKISFDMGETFSDISYPGIDYLCGSCAFDSLSKKLYMSAQINSTNSQYIISKYL